MIRQWLSSFPPSCARPPTHKILTTYPWEHGESLTHTNKPCEATGVISLSKNRNISHNVEGRGIISRILLLDPGEGDSWRSLGVIEKCSGITSLQTMAYSLPIVFLQFSIPYASSNFAPPPLRVVWIRIWLHRAYMYMGLPERQISYIFVSQYATRNTQLHCNSSWMHLDLSISSPVSFLHAFVFTCVHLCATWLIRWLTGKGAKDSYNPPLGCLSGLW